MIINTATDGAITAERIAVARQVFGVAGFGRGFATADEIDKAREWIFLNDEALGKLPKYVLGNLDGLHTEGYRRTLMALIRRIAQFLQLSVVRKRQKYLKKW